MSGIKLKNPDERKGPLLPPAEKDKIQKKKQTLKMIFYLVVTNTFFYLLFSNDGTQENFKPRPKKDLVIYKNHPKHKKLKIPLKIFFPFHNTAGEIPISIYGKNKKILIKKAFLHPDASARPESKDSIDPLINNEENIKFITVEIHISEIDKLIQGQNDYFLAYPFFYSNVPKQPTRKKQYGNIYEIIF